MLFILRIVGWLCVSCCGLLVAAGLLMVVWVWGCSGYLLFVAFAFGLVGLFVWRWLPLLRIGCIRLGFVGVCCWLFCLACVCIGYYVMGGGYGCCVVYLLTSAVD